MEPVYNNAKYVITGQIFFKINSGYHLGISFKKDTNPYLRSYLAKKLAKKLENLISICHQNLLYAQKL